MSMGAYGATPETESGNMSQLHSGARQLTYNLKAFLGVNENADGDANLKAGEAAVMRNFQVTDNGALRVRPGYELAIEGFEPTERISYYPKKYSDYICVLTNFAEKVTVYDGIEIVDEELALAEKLGVVTPFFAEDMEKLNEWIDRTGGCYVRHDSKPYLLTGLSKVETASGGVVYRLEGKEVYINRGIAGMWAGNINGESTLLFARDDTLYAQKFDIDDNPSEVKKVGAIRTNGHVEAFFFDDKVYLLDGEQYYSYDGDSFDEVEGYAPVVITAADASGSGTLYEAVNKLTTDRRIRYSADGTSTEYKLPETAFVFEVYVDGKELANGTDYTANSEKITFTTAPAAGSANIEVLYAASTRAYYPLKTAASGQTVTIKEANGIDFIGLDDGNWTERRLYEGVDYTRNGTKVKLKFPTEEGWVLRVVYNLGNGANPRTMCFAENFNGAADTRIFLYGDGTNKSVYSGITEDGTPSAEYFPDLNEMRVGDENTPISSMIRHYNRLLAFKRGGGTYSIYYGQLSLADGSVTAGFYLNSVNKIIGCARDDGAVLVLNHPRTIEKGVIYEWTATSTSGNITSDQRNAQVVSAKVHDTIKDFNMEEAVTFYDRRRHEYYCAYNGVAVVQNTETGAWYIYTNFPATSMIDSHGELLFGTADGLIYRLNSEITTDNGAEIAAYWESGSLDFGRSDVLKYSPKIWLSAKPIGKSIVSAGIITDSGTEITKQMDFSVADGMAKTQMAKLKSRKFAYYKLRLSMREAGEHATILSTVIKAAYDIPVK